MQKRVGYDTNHRALCLEVFDALLALDLLVPFFVQKHAFLFILVHNHSAWE